MSSFPFRVARTTILSVLLAVAPAPAWAQKDQAAKIDAYVRAEIARRHIPGLALLVTREHRVVFAANYGITNLELNAPVTDSTSFEIASMTKQFTDAVILRLAERGKLALSDHLSKFLPDLPPSWQPITLQQLMNHTAGLRDDWDEDDSFFYSRTTPEEFFEALEAVPLKFVPGTDWSYGCGPFLLGLVIQRVTGEPFAQFIRESVFQPLGMSFTDVNDPVAVVPGRAAGYVMRGGVIRNGVRISAAAEARADVGIRSTARDLARWDAALDDTSLLSDTSRELMFTPGQLSSGERIPYGLGWFVTPFRGHTEIEHGGGFRTGFSSVIARYPDDRLAVIVLTNLQGSLTPHARRPSAGFSLHSGKGARPRVLSPARAAAHSGRLPSSVMNSPGHHPPLSSIARISATGAQAPTEPRSSRTVSIAQTVTSHGSGRSASLQTGA